MGIECEEGDSDNWHDILNRDLNKISGFLYKNIENHKTQTPGKELKCQSNKNTAYLGWSHLRITMKCLIRFLIGLGCLIASLI